MKKLKHNLIGISGALGSGKDLIGSIINYLSHSNYEALEENRIKDNQPLIEAIEWVNTEHYTTYTIKKYADALKDICCIILGCTREQLEDREFKETPIPHLTKYEVKYFLKKMPEQGCFYTKIFPDSESAEKNVSMINNEFIHYEINPIYTTPRDIQNDFGTRCGRDMIHQNIWCEALFSKYKGHKLKKFISEEILDGYRHTACKHCDKRFTGYKRQLYCNNCIDDLVQIFPNWLITDVRFPNNEGKYIKDRNGIVIGIKRRFSLRFPEYAHLENPENIYAVPEELKEVDSILYKRITSSSEVSMGDFSWCDVIIENNGSIEELVEQVKKIIWR